MKIAIFSKNNNFMDGIFDELRKRGHELRHYAICAECPEEKSLLTGNETIDRLRFARLLDWCDVAYVEFIEDLAFEVSAWKELSNLETPLVMRLHRIELYEPYMQNVNWHVVDDLIFVAPQCKRKFDSFLQSPGYPKRTHLIPNGYDDRTFNIPDDKFYGNTMIMAGNIYWKKGHYDMIEFMSRESMEDWQLNIVGNPRSGQGGSEYFVNCTDAAKNREVMGRVTFRESVDRRTLNNIFAQNSIVISASLEEGTHCVIAEGMLAGLYPLVRAWEGAEEMYPPECVWRNQDELQEKLDWWSRLSKEDKRKGSEHMRLWVQKRYDYKTQAKKACDVIEGAAR